MSLHKTWLGEAYEPDGTQKKKTWDKHLPLEQKIYEKMLSKKAPEIKGTVKELAKKHGMTQAHYVGFLDGINEALDTPLDVEALDANTLIDATVDFAQLYKKMVEFKAEHLYTLPEWDKVFSEDERKALYAEQKASGTVRRAAAKIGRNDPCPCGSGKKYKQCCI